MDFSAAAESYSRHRQGFPPSFFKRVPLKGVVLDLGSGTGTLAKGYAEQGCVVCAVDISNALMRRGEGTYVKLVSRAEDCTFADETFDAIVVGQAWHWFDESKVISMCRRVLKPNGRVVIASLDYRLSENNLAARTEKLLLKFNPQWPLAGFKDYLPERAQMLRQNEFVSVTTHEFDEPIQYTKEGWRGRMQACNGVMKLPQLQQQQFDRELTQLLEPEIEPMNIEHRVSWVAGTKAG